MVDDFPSSLDLVFRILPRYMIDLIIGCVPDGLRLQQVRSEPAGEYLFPLYQFLAELGLNPFMVQLIFFDAFTCQSRDRRLKRRIVALLAAASRRSFSKQSWAAERLACALSKNSRIMDVPLKEQIRDRMALTCRATNDNHNINCITQISRAFFIFVNPIVATSAPV